MKKSLLYSLIGGILLCVPFNAVGYLPYLDQECFFLPLLCVGAIIALGTLLFQNRQFKYAVFRLFLILSICIVSLRFTAITGITTTLYKSFSIVESQGTGLASGLIMALFSTAILGVGIIISGIIGAIQLKNRLTKTQNTGDGSLS